MSTPGVHATQPEQDALARDAVRAIYQQSPQGLVIGFVLGAMFVYAFQAVVGPWTAGIWYATLAASQLAGWHLLVRFNDVAPTDDWSPEPWQRRYRLSVWRAGVILGVCGWLFFDPTFGDLRWLTVLTLCGISAGSVTSYAYHLPTLYGFLVLVNAPLFVQLISAGATGTWVSPTVHLFYISMLAWFGRTQHGTLTGSLRIRHENTALVNRLREQTEALAQLSAAKSQFFAAASHDLRQPLHALGYYTELLTPNDHDAAYVERIRQCVGTLDELIEGVLDISRLDAATVHPQTGPVDLRALLEEQARLYEPLAASKGLQLRVHSTHDWTVSDPVLLQRIVSNLVSNAIRYTDRGGVLLAVRRRGDGLRLQVFDTGCGIPEDQRERIFNEFVQLNNPHRDPRHGVGLGLATVHRLCALLGHALQVHSMVGRGSCFEIELPRTAALPPPHRAGVPTADTTALRGRVLLVEDNPLVRESLQTTLQQWGLTCDTATDGHTALSLAAQHTYAALLCDWRLPGDLDGTQVITRVRELQPTLSLAALLTGEMTGQIDTLPAGVTLMSKPVKPIRLRALLTAHLRP